MSITEFPTELQQMIFDALGTRDARAFVRFRLVSKAWAQMTRKLQVDFCVLPGMTARRVRSILEMFPRVQTLRLPECFKIHLPSWPYLKDLRYMRCLNVSCVHAGDVRVIASIGQLQSLKISFSTLKDVSLSCLERLNNLTSLKIVSCMLPMELKIVDHFHRLQELSFKVIIPKK